VSSTGAFAAPSSVAKGESPKLIRAREVERSLESVQKWVEDHIYRGYEPFDGMSSWARPLALGNLFAEPSPDAVDPAMPSKPSALDHFLRLESAGSKR
jgi:hypothetical protein